MRVPTLASVGRGEVRQERDPDGVLWTAYALPTGARVWEVVGPLIGLAFAAGTLVLGLFVGLAEGWLFVIIGLVLMTLMAPWTAMGLRRALRERDSLRVSALGVWIPEIGTIPWSEVESVGVEDTARALSSTHPDEPAPMNRAPRLVIRLRRGKPLRGRRAPVRFLLSLARLGEPPMVGVYEFELPVRLDDVLPTIERYRQGWASIRGVEAGAGAGAGITGSSAGRR